MRRLCLTQKYDLTKGENRGIILKKEWFLLSDINTTADNPNKKRVMISVICIMILLATSLMLGYFYSSSFNKIIYTNKELNFYSQNGNFVVFAKDFAGVYKQSGQKNETLTLHTPLIGVPPDKIGFDNENKTISGKKFSTLKRFNFDFTLGSLFQTNLLSSDINSINENVKKIKIYNNVSWFSESILEKERKCARIVDDKGNSLFEVYFSETGKIESALIKNDTKSIEAIKSFFNINKASSLQFTETPLGNSVFYAVDGTVSAIKNKANGRIEKFEIRLYGSSGLLFIENFLTDIESIRH